MIKRVIFKIVYLIDVLVELIDKFTEYVSSKLDKIF